MKIIKTGIEARTALANGAKQLADAVGSTLGPFGNNFFLEKKERPTNDGVSIAREFQLKDEIENMGMKAIRESAIKTVDEVGDGTTSAIVFAYAVYNQLSRFLGKEGVAGSKKPSELKQQLWKEKEEVIAKLKEMATPIETEEQLVNSARVSVEDEEMGKLIGEAQWNLGKDGFLLAEETAERTSSVDIVKGIRIDNGFGTSQLVNNHEKQTLELKDVSIMLTSHTMRDFKSIERLVNQFIKSGKRDMVIIARAWTDEAIGLCMENIKKGGFMVYPLSAPYVNMQERFKDLAAVLGATFFDSESSSLEDMQLSDIGFAKKVIARRYDAILTGQDNEETQARVNKRVEELKAKLAGSESEFEKKQLNERIAQLTNGFGIVKVGSSSDMERKRLFDKVEDAVNAVRVAFREGTVKGAGLAFKEVSDSLPDTYLLKRPLLSIYEQVMFNAPSNFVVEDWVRDPLAVMKCVLEKGVESASALATAGGAICTETNKPLDEYFRANMKSSQ